MPPVAIGYTAQPVNRVVPHLFGNFRVGFHVDGKPRVAVQHGVLVLGAAAIEPQHLAHLLQLARLIGFLQVKAVCNYSGSQTWLFSGV